MSCILCFILNVKAYLVCEPLHFSLSFIKPPGFTCHGCHMPQSICSHSSHSVLCAIPAPQEHLHQFSACSTQLASAKEWRDSPTALSLPGGWAVTWMHLLIWLMTVRKDWLICGEGEEKGEGLVVGGVDGLILLLGMMNSEGTGKLLFLKAAQT